MEATLAITPDPVRNARKAADDEIAAMRAEALAATFKPKPSNEWISTKEWWKKATEAERRDMVYGLCAHSAAKPKQIAKYFSIKESDLTPYQEQLKMGEATRILKIQQHQMRWAFATNMPNAKFFLGLQFAGQVQNPAHEDAPSLDEKKDSGINIHVIPPKAKADTATTGDIEVCDDTESPVRTLQ